MILLPLLMLAADPPPEFWKQWGDGMAEVATYDLTMPRYGANRRGVAVAIFVTEPFSKSTRVKADPGKHPPSDQFPVMKLNLIKEFQTGIYDYSDMTSVFAALSGNRGVTKISFSGQEWCGHVWQQFLFDDNAVRYTGHSYFDGEGDWSKTLELPAAGIAEDALFHWARGMTGPSLQPGESRKVRMLMSAERSRFEHKPAAWINATLEHSKTPSANVYRAVLDTGLTKTFHVETAGQRRIVEWKFSNGEAGKLIASERLKYWELNKPGNEAILKKLRVTPRGPRSM